jgi:hypothetical protein
MVTTAITPLPTPPDSGLLLNAERHDLLETILLKVHACASHPVPDPDMLPLLVLAWHEALTEVPTADLAEVYRRAISQHTSAFPLSTGELLTTWQTLRAERRGPRYRLVTRRDHL